MIGLVIVSHGQLAEALVEAAEFIFGHQLEAVATVRVEAGQKPEELKAALTAALGRVETGQGAIILTDMFGGSPSDMSLSFLKPDRVEVLTGVNLPMLLHLASRRIQEPQLNDLAQEAVHRAHESITSASELLSA